MLPAADDRAQGYRKVAEDQSALVMINQRGGGVPEGRALASAWRVGAEFDLGQFESASAAEGAAKN